MISISMGHPFIMHQNVRNGIHYSVLTVLIGLTGHYLAQFTLKWNYILEQNQSKWPVSCKFLPFLRFGDLTIFRANIKFSKTYHWLHSSQDDVEIFGDHPSFFNVQSFSPESDPPKLDFCRIFFLTNRLFFFVVISKVGFLLSRADF